MKFRNFITESIHNYLSEQMNNSESEFFDNIKLKTEDVFNLIQYHDSYRDLYPNYSNDENEYEEDYFFQSKEIAYDDVNETLNFFNSLPNPIPIYRAIKVKSMDDIDFDYLGDSWSFDKDSAINFAHNNNLGNVLISGKTKFNNVDWTNTLSLFYLFSKGFDGYEENEINVINPDEIFDVNVEKI